MTRAVAPQPFPNMRLHRSLILAALTLALGSLATVTDPAPAVAQSPIPVYDGPPPTAVEYYGADSLQWGALRMPEGPGPFPVAVVIHGGCWIDALGEGSLTPLAAALVDEGIATWDVEYRRLGHEGGGWPGSFLDVGAAVDYVRVLASDYPLDLERVVTVGHSSGAHYAVWAAGRPGLPSSSEIRGDDPFPVRAAVGIDGPMDLAAFRESGVCETAIARLLGGEPDEQPERYAQASPLLMPPFQADIYLNPAGMMFQVGDPEVMARRAAETGETVVVNPVPESNHFQLITPGHATFEPVVETIRAALQLDEFEIAERGAMVMPFDLDRSTHVFEPREDGGRQSVISDDGDPAQIALIREHLAHEAERFARGDFHDPAMIHGQDMAGLHTLMMGHERMTVSYADVEGGGEILYTSDDADIVRAIHAWFEQQVRDHGAHAHGGH